MVMTQPAEGTATADADGGAPRRVVRRTPGVPGGRAVVGGLLIASAGMGTFVTWQQASGMPDHDYAVASRTLQPGDPITQDAVRFEAIDLPDDVAAAAFRTPAELEGRVVVGPVGQGELLQQGALSDQGDADAAAEVSVSLARELAVDGRLDTGDTVDVYATHDDTRLVAEGVRVISVSEPGGSFGDGRDLTVTLALVDPALRVPVIHAARDGQITLVRTTHLARRSAAAGAEVPTAAPGDPADPGGPVGPGDPASTPGADAPGPPPEGSSSEGAAAGGGG